MPAEWEHNGCVLLAWPHASTDWAYMLRQVQDCYLHIIKAVKAGGTEVILIVPKGDTPQIEGVYTVNVDTNDTWIRDYGPLTVDDGGSLQLLDFRFNAWGQKFASNLDNQANRALGRAKVFAAPAQCHKDFVLEGGSIESDGRGTLLTTACCLLAPNRNEPMTRAGIERELCRRLGARKVLWLDHGALAGDDTDGHIDTLCRLAPGNTILFTGTADTGDEHYDTLSKMRRQLQTFTDADGEPFNLIELPLPDAVYDPEEGTRLPATYANYLVTPQAVIMPTYGQPLKDKLAADTLRVAYPAHEIIGVDCLPLIRQHGSLHCATMQIPKEIVSFI